MTTVFQQVGRYAIQRELGRGGMATVFLATDTQLDSEVALKQVPVGSDREARDILEAEEWGAQLQAHFSRMCDAVPKVYDYWKDGDYLYIAMEYLDGRNLSDLVAAPLEPARAVEIAIALCRFLEAAHTFRVTIGGRDFTSLHHSDLKPRNIRITSAGAVKVLDFGIAKALSLSRKVTRNDFGSVPYLSPERLESGGIDVYSDLWALGVVLYEMLRGEQPFTAVDTRQLERRIVSREPPPSLAGRCAPALQAVVSKLLAPAVGERYATAAAIREDLERMQAGVRTHAEEEGWCSRGADAPTTRTRPAVDDEATRRTVRPADVAPPRAPRRTIFSIAGRLAWAVVSRPVRTAKVILLVVAFAIVANEIAVSQSANELAASVRARQLPELEEAWRQYDALYAESNLHIAVLGLRRALLNRTLELSEHVMEAYRNASPSLREAQWMAMRTADERALAADPENRRLKAAARYGDGHLHRIAGEARKAKHDASGARQELTEAVTAFREAAELRPDWPDPFLALMRTFIYGLDDLERGENALRQAERLGYASGSREIAQLADGYRARGDRLARGARLLRGLPQEQPSLEKAAESFRRALELYAKATDYARSAASIRLAQRGLDQVEQRLRELAGETADS
jgi:eukaryotic-like serine/threonine-protein kinase